MHSLGILVRYILWVSDAEPEEVEAFIKKLGPLAIEAYMTGEQILQQRLSRSILVEQLQERFGEVPGAALQRIEQAGLQELRDWLKRFAKAESVEEVLEEPTPEDQPSA